MEPELTPTSESSSWPKIFFTGTLMVLVLGGILFAYQVSCRKLNSIPEKSPVREFLFIVETRGKTAIARIGNCGLKKMSYRGLTPIEVAHSKEVMIGLFTNRLGKTDVYEIKNSGQPELLTDNGENKSNLALSPDGKLFAFTRGTGENQEIRILALNKLNEITTVDFGSNAQFLDNETVLYLSRNGFTLKNIRTGSGSGLEDPSVVTNRKFFSAGVNDIFMTRNFLISQMDVFKIKSRIPLFVEPTQSILGEFTDASISSGIFYGIIKNGDGISTLVTKKGDVIEPIFTFPLNVAPKDLIE